MPYDKYVERYLKKVREEVSEPNRQLILDFAAQCRAERLSEERLREYVRLLYRIESMLAKPFPEATRNDIVRVINALDAVEEKHMGYNGKEPRIINEKLSENYLLGYKITLKKFYKWQNGGEEYPDCVKWLKCTQKSGPRVSKEDILSPEQIMSIVDACDTLRDRCFIHMTYELGARSGEMIELVRKDVKFTNEGAVIAVTNEKYRKGEKRYIPIVNSMPDLVLYMKNMPDKSPDAFLWVCEGRKNNGNQISKSAMGRILKRAAERAGVKKRVWLHLLRHCRCTHVSHLLTDAVKREMFNWSKRSDMPAYYTHLSSEQTQESILANVYGIKNGEGTDLFCPCCKAKQSSSEIKENQRCWRCNHPLDEKAIANEVNLRAEMEDLKEFRNNIQKLIDEAVKRKIDEMGLEYA